MLHKKNLDSNNVANTQGPILGENLHVKDLTIIAKAGGVNLEWKGASILVVTGTVEAVALWSPILTLRKEEILDEIFKYGHIK